MRMSSSHAPVATLLAPDIVASIDRYFESRNLSRVIFEGREQPPQLSNRIGPAFRFSFGSSETS